MFRKLVAASSRSNYKGFFKSNAHIITSGIAAGTIVIHNSKEQTQCDAAIFAPPIHNLVPLTMSVVKVQETTIPETMVDKIKNKTYEAVKNISSMIRYVNRVLTYALFGLPLAGLVPISYVYPPAEDITWEYATWAITKLGPCFIKMAQWVSTRPDLFPPKLIQRIECLQDDVKTNYSFAVVENTLSDAFGKDWKSSLVLDPNPLGAGSVAQVFRGTMQKANESIDVAVKMIHPHVAELVKTDMELLTHLANFMDRVPALEILSLGESFREFASVMNEQLDLRVEAKNLIKFTKKFAHEKWAEFPMPVEGFVTKNVLVETLMEGVPITKYMKMTHTTGDAVDKLKLKLSDLGCRLILKMIFFDNFIHGDLHPGNMLVRFKANGEPTLVILDTGIVYQSRSESEHKRLVDICLAFMKHDGRLAGKLMIENAATVNGHKNSPEHSAQFCEAIQGIVTQSESENYFEHLAEYFMMVCDLAREHNVRLDPGYFRIVMALKVAEGIALALNRELDLVSTCVPIIVKAQALRALGIEKFPLPEDENIQHTKPVKAAKK